MAGTKISELTELTTPTGNEEIPYAYNGENGKIKLSNIGGGTPTVTYLASSTTSPSSAVSIANYDRILLQTKRPGNSPYAHIAHICPKVQLLADTNGVLFTEGTNTTGKYYYNSSNQTIQVWTTSSATTAYVYGISF